MEAADPLAVRMLSAEPGRLGEHVLVLTELEASCESLFGAVKSKFVETAGFGRGEIGMRDVDQRGAPPESECPAQNRHRQARIAGQPRLPPLPEQLLEANRVD